MPGLLILVARDLFLFDPPRVLAWRLLHEPRLADVPAWLGPFVPRPSGAWDRDPLALLLGALAMALATAYLIAGLLRCGPRLRASLLAVAAFLLVVLPTLGFVAMGAVTDRPYGQDGGVVQLPLAIEKILAGHSPYGADYSDSILGKEARVSGFWTPYGGNPILRHHAYLPGTHLLMLPFYLLSRFLFGFFDPRVVTLLAYGAAVLLAAWCCPADPAKRLAAAALVAVNPLVYWHQIFGANDVLLVALLLGAVSLGRRERPLVAAAVLGLACATKQLAWPFAPFLLLALTGLGRFRDLAHAAFLRRLVPLAGVLVAVLAVVVLPVAALDFKAFWGDIVVYNVGLPGGDNYPLGGTPGFGFANFLIYSGAVRSLRDYFPFGLFYLLLAPLGLLLLRRQLRENGAPAALVAGSVALLASLYFSRVVHPNYLILAAILIPVGLLMGLRVRADGAVVPLLLFAVAVEVVEQEILRTTWEDTAGLATERVFGWFAGLGPRAAPGLTNDPIGLVVGAVAAGLGLAYLVIAFVGDYLEVSARVRTALIVVAFVLLVGAPAAFVIRVGTLTGRPRVQDAWMAQALAGPDRSPATAPLEAWSQSFRRDPPSPMAQRPRSASAVTLAGWLVPLGVDARWLSLIALALGGYFLARSAAAEHKALLLGVALVSAPALVGVCFGSTDPLVLPLLLAAMAVTARPTRPAFFVRGVLYGALCGLTSRFFWPLLLLFRRRLQGPRYEGAAWAIPGAAVGLALAAGPEIGRLGVAAFDSQRSNPGVGWRNVLAYWGLDQAPVAVVILGAVVFGLVVGGAHARRWREAQEAGLPGITSTNLPGWLAVALLLEMFFRESSPHELLVPLVLLALAAVHVPPVPPGNGAADGIVVSTGAPGVLEASAGGKSWEPRTADGRRETPHGPGWRSPAGRSWSSWTTTSRACFPKPSEQPSTLISRPVPLAWPT